MPIVFLGAANAAIVRLRCPACEFIQVRARRPRDEPYDCRSCGREFSLEKGLIPADDSERRW